MAWQVVVGHWLVYGGSTSIIDREHLDPLSSLFAQLCWEEGLGHYKVTVLLLWRYMEEQNIN